jgi:putative Holliday junction resolvase
MYLIDHNLESEEDVNRRYLQVDHDIKHETRKIKSSEITDQSEKRTRIRYKELFDYLKDYVAREEVERMVIGEPKQPNGQPSENLQRVQQFVNRWRKAMPQIPIEYYDERFTSVLAHQAMLDGGLKKKARQDKALVDEISATIILEDFMRSRKK